MIGKYRYTYNVNENTLYVNENTLYVNLYPNV